MNFFNAKEFEGRHAWEALDLAEIEGASVRLHWTDKPYKWHVNDGDEVFVVLEGQVRMFYRKAGGEHSHLMNPGAVFVALEGEEHVAHPQGAARVLVIEKKGSV